MKYIIYHCYGGNHLSVVAAALHVGFLPSHRLPSLDEVKSCPYFDSFHKHNAGELHYMGQDINNNQVFTLGCLGAGKLVEKIINEIMHALGDDGETILMVNLSPALNIPLKIGGFLSRGLGLIFPGRWLALKGVLWSYPVINQVVKKTWSQIKNIN